MTIDCAYTIEGQGPALFLIHGIGARRATFAELVEGQTKEVQYQYDTDHSTDDYMKVIEGKTASLIIHFQRILFQKMKD